MGIKGLVKQVLTEKQNRRYQRRLSDKCVTYGEWVARQEAFDWSLGDCARPSAGINEARNKEPEVRNKEAASLQCGEFVVLGLADEQVQEAACAIEYIDRYFRLHPEVKVLYGDEDVKDERSVRRSPWFKPDWSPDLLDSCFYPGSLVAVRRELWDELAQDSESAGVRNEPIHDCDGTVRKEGDAVKRVRLKCLTEYVDLVHRCMEWAGGYTKGCVSIGHFPGILCHVRDEKVWEKFFAADREWKTRTGECADALEQPEAQASWRVSVIIPSKDNPAILRKCIEGCLATKCPALEIIVVDNGSSPENQEHIEELLEELRCRAQDGAVIRYRVLPMEFNFSKMCNIGAGEAKGEMLLFLNDDVELCRMGCLQRMARMAQRSYTGAVGLKLYYPESDKIQHAGITNLPMGPVHKLQFKRDNKRYYFGANEGCRNFLAVTAACLMVEKKKYLEAGGFCEEMRVAFNDVDLCFTLFELGYQNVCVNDCFAYHHESLSRGGDEASDKLERLLDERRRLYERHPKLEGVDPYYSVHLNRRGLDTSVRPCYESGREEVQSVGHAEGHFEVEGYRQDNCLLIRVEEARGRKISGYGVVLGDNNACYDKKLLLKDSSGQIYAVALSGGYRIDLAENMPDQRNVALSGFEVQMEIGAIPDGRYQIGIAARNRVTGLKLVNWSNRVVELRDGRQ